MPVKKVYIIGAGPGDRGLLTLKAFELVKKADTIIYDNLVSSEILSLAKDGCRKIYAGKGRSGRRTPQNKINRLLLKEASGRGVVVRLKGGDPFIFGRGGEELEYLKENNIKYEIVPGVTSAIASPAYAGIPLTHRKFASTVGFITGHEDPLKRSSLIEWDKISTGLGTLVFLMGVKNLKPIARRLIASGRAPGTPVAIIERGTLPEQRVIKGKLGDIAAKARRAHVAPPSVIVVGEVAKFADSHKWFGSGPLAGRRIVVTRSRKQSSDFVRMLEDKGAKVIEIPAIELSPLINKSRLEKAIRNIDKYDWVIFTSANGVRYFFKALYGLKKDARGLRGPKFCAIGEVTQGALMGFGVRADLVPREYISESIIKAFSRLNLKGKRILLPRSQGARGILPEGLKEMGARVESINIYKPLKPRIRVSELKKRIEGGRVDLLTFASSSTVENFVKLLGSGGPNGALSKIPVAAIGPITARTARRLGFKVSITAGEHTISALVNAIIRKIGTHPNF